LGLEPIEQTLAHVTLTHVQWGLWKDIGVEMGVIIINFTTLKHYYYIWYSSKCIMRKQWYYAKDFFVRSIYLYLNYGTYTVPYHRFAPHYANMILTYQFLFGELAIHAQDWFLSNLCNWSEKPISKKKTNHPNENRIPFHFCRGIVQKIVKAKRKPILQKKTNPQLIFQCL
jgi:hypothetical protein